MQPVFYAGGAAATLLIAFVFLFNDYVTAAWNAVKSFFVGFFNPHKVPEEPIATKTAECVIESCPFCEPVEEDEQCEPPSPPRPATMADFGNLQRSLQGEMKQLRIELLEATGGKASFIASQEARQKAAEMNAEVKSTLEDLSIITRGLSGRMAQLEERMAQAEARERSISTNVEYLLKTKIQHATTLVDLAAKVKEAVEKLPPPTDSDEAFFEMSKRTAEAQKIARFTTEKFLEQELSVGGKVFANLLSAIESRKPQKKEIADLHKQLAELTVKRLKRRAAPRKAAK